jgi:hypothetical protein
MTVREEYEVGLNAERALGGSLSTADTFTLVKDSFQQPIWKFK